MIVVSARDLTKADGTDVILENVSFHINQGDRVGIIGINGAGKTTLLRMLTGELPYEEGDCFISSDLRIGYLKQDAGFDSERTILEEAQAVFDHFPQMEREMQQLLQQASEDPQHSEAALGRYEQIHERYDRMGGYSYQSELRGILTSMAFDESMYDKKIRTLSGGEKTRLALAILLLEKPDILFLDEPTNHLDIGTLKWLEQYLRGYRGTIVLVSHDRYFLNETVTRIFEVENHRLNIYEGNYAFYAAERKVRRETELRTYEKQQKEIARQEEMIRRFKQRGTEKLAKRAASRERQLEHMQRLERPGGEHGKMSLQFHQEFQSGKDVLLAEDLSKAFGYGHERRELFHGVRLDLKRGERVCIVGDNGTGKTTLLRMFLGETEPGAGRIRIGHNVQFGYYDQGQQLLNDDLTVIEELQDAYHLYSDGELRNILGRFLFRGEQVFLPVGSLSGGEKARLSLLKLMLSGSNVLVLDEPTNHLDIESKEVFEEALLDFPGTCIIVSHDRYFLNKIPTRICELTREGLVEYLGKYDYYVEKKQEQNTREHMQQLSQGGRAASPKTPREGIGQPLHEEQELTPAEQRRRKKEQEAEERRTRRAREAAEAEIARLEEEIEGLQRELALPEIMTDAKRLQDLSEQLSRSQEALDAAYEKWVELQEEV
ncbi:MAG: ABC-F family ATP-binding cassette domain-containing protein [Firmicutes bacterium]|nr:ABC-F family ATP-binding cassette domain-containing protein [Bacillota bacterium]